MNGKQICGYCQTSGYVSQRWTSLLIAGLFMCGIAGQTAAESVDADLIIHATGFTHDGGQAIASLFREGDDVFKKPFLRVKVKIDHEQATLVFPHIAFGNYAAIVFHDENDNDDLDHNMLHFPAEPLGYSNGFKLGLFTGLPNFEKLHFAFAVDKKPIEITVK